MSNTSVFLASFFAAGFAVWLLMVLPHKIDCWLRVRRRVRDSQPAKVSTTVTTAKAAIKPPANSNQRIISVRPFVMLETK